MASFVVLFTSEVVVEAAVDTVFGLVDVDVTSLTVVVGFGLSVAAFCDVVALAVVVLLLSVATVVCC